jgi:Leucine-rich repeat (LRR) protein
LASWNVSFACCHWEGVSCDSRTGGVVAVDLHNCSLTGILRPAALFNLTALEHLDVSFNDFTGLPIPTEIGLLKNLKYLNLSTAGFAGTVPWQLGNLNNLTGLDLSSPPSQLTSPDLSWLAKLTALTNLSLNGVDHGDNQ